MAQQQSPSSQLIGPPIPMRHATRTLSHDRPVYAQQKRVIKLRDQILAIARENTTQSDPADIAATRAALDPLCAQLQEIYVRNRPVNEVALTQRSWRSLWYDDDDIADRFTIHLDRNRIWQVIPKKPDWAGESYYYNVSQSSLACCCGFPTQGYLKGTYEITGPPCGPDDTRKKLNVIDLIFDYNGIKLGALPPCASIPELVEKVEFKNAATPLPIPGLIGTRGELWNFYIDECYRFVYGIDLSRPDVLDLYILELGDTVPEARRK